MCSSDLEEIDAGKIVAIDRVDPEAGIDGAEGDDGGESTGDDQG